MRATHLFGTYVPDLTEGISKNINHLCRALAHEGVSVRLDGPNTDLAALNDHNLLLTRGWATHQLARRALADPEVDLVHYHTSIPTSAFFASLARARSKDPTAPLLVHLWNPYFDSRAPGAKLPLTERWPHKVFNSRAATAVALLGLPDILVSSRFQARQLQRLHYAGRVHVIPNGVDGHEYRPATDERRSTARRLLGVTGDPVLLYYGHLSPWKGVDDLIDALPAILREEPRAQLLLAHTAYGTKRHRLIERLRGAGALDRVLLLGPTDVPTLLAAADIAILPNRGPVGTACHPNVLLECMAAALPIVTTRVGSIPEVIESGRNGVLVDPGQPSQLGDAVARVARDRPLQRRLSSEARRDAAERFDWASIGRRMRRLYSQLERGTPVPPIPLAMPEAEGTMLRWSG